MEDAVLQSLRPESTAGFGEALARAVRSVETSANDAVAKGRA
jgi:hypothetical protein